MKRLLLILITLFTLQASGQQIGGFWKAKRIDLTEGLTIRGYRADSLSNDTSLAGRIRTIATAKSVYDFTTGRIGALTARMLDSISSVKQKYGRFGLEDSIMSSINPNRSVFIDWTRKFKITSGPYPTPGATQGLYFQHDSLLAYQAVWLATGSGKEGIGVGYFGGRGVYLRTGDTAHVNNVTWYPSNESIIAHNTLGKLVRIPTSAFNSVDSAFIPGGTDSIRFVRKHQTFSIKLPSGGVGGTWGSITGTLSSQTDLQTALNSKQASHANLTALSAYNTNGLFTQTASGTYTGRTLTGTSNRITVTNGNGVSGNPTVDIASAYIGQSTITTVGTISTGTWQGSAISTTYGGIPTGGTTGQVLTKTSGSNYAVSWQTPSGGGGSGITRSINTISTNTTGGTTAGTDYVYFASGNITFTLPAAAGNTNAYTVIKTDSSNVITIANAYTAITLDVEGESRTFISNGTTWYEKN